MSKITLDYLSPFIPSENSIRQSGLADKVLELHSSSAKLTGVLAVETRSTLEKHMSVINSYYSNLIEGNRTLPHEIRKAQRGDFSTDPAKRDLQLESLAHVEVQEWIASLNLDSNFVFSEKFIKNIHFKFYSKIPKTLWALKNKSGEIVDEVKPGEWRSKNVSVGRHEPPAVEDLSELMSGFFEVFNLSRYVGHEKIIAAMSAHHRLLWIHPFSDGNGRVARLFTDAALKLAGLESCGVWCLSRGLARTSTNYKAFLSNADHTRYGDLDGRGFLSEKALEEFCAYMVNTALDQVEYIANLLELEELRARMGAYVRARNDRRILGMTNKINDAAKLILHRAFASGALDRSTALELTGLPERSARRLLAQMKEEGLLSETSSKSALYWEIPEHAEPWYFPQLAPSNI